MLKPNIEKTLNFQINREFYSSYLYLSISSYLNELGLTGYSHWFRVQAMEERDHALLIYDYIHKSGGSVTLDAIETPPKKFDGVLACLKKSAEHEALVTGLINDIVTLANEEKDHKTASFFTWFVNEQVEEEDNAATNIKKYELMGTDGKGLYLLDQEMAARIYNPPSIASVQIN